MALRRRKKGFHRPLAVYCMSNDFTIEMYHELQKQTSCNRSTFSANPLSTPQSNLGHSSLECRSGVIRRPRTLKVARNYAGDKSSLLNFGVLVLRATYGDFCTNVKGLGATVRRGSACSPRVTAFPRTESKHSKA